MVNNDTSFAIISDQLGSVRLVVNTITGEVKQRIDYDEFGMVLSNSNEDFQPFTYVGGLSDADTKLVRFGVHDYDSKIGRWTSKDLIMFKGGSSNLFEYVVNDPINMMDPNGEQFLYDLLYDQAAFVAKRVGVYLTGGFYGGHLPMKEGFGKEGQDLDFDGRPDNQDEIDNRTSPMYWEEYDKQIENANKSCKMRIKLENALTDIQQTNFTYWYNILQKSIKTK